MTEFSIGIISESLKYNNSLTNIIKNEYDIVICSLNYLNSCEYKDIITSNPSKKYQYLPIVTNCINYLYLQVIINILRVGGRCALIIPYDADLNS